jgi:hypothetical protein
VRARSFAHEASAVEQQQRQRQQQQAASSSSSSSSSSMTTIFPAALSARAWREGAEEKEEVMLRQFGRNEKYWNVVRNRKIVRGVFEWMW